MNLESERSTFHAQGRIIMRDSDNQCILFPLRAPTDPPATSQKPGSVIFRGQQHSNLIVDLTCVEMTEMKYTVDSCNINVN